ncbi:MAG: D-alanyl-D-alanine carboxypeptidase/D-alanyl-D-alanine-endopeptidase [Sumerlaeia bacterium]
MTLKTLSLCLLFPAAMAVPLAAQEAAPPPSPQAMTREELVSRIEETFQDPRFAGALWGARIESLENGELWYSLNADQLFIPASNQKIPTTAAALSLLGPDFRYETRLETLGTVTSDTLHGDLILWGHGDPTFYTRFFDEPREPLRALARQLKDAGIARIAGDVVGDDDAWDDQHMGGGMTFGGSTAWYGAPFGPLQINEGYVDFKVLPPDSVDGEVRIEPNLPSAFFTLDTSGVEVVADGRSRVRIERGLLDNAFVATGQVEAGAKPFEQSPSIHNPTLFITTVMAEVLKAEGIEVAGQPIDIDDAPAKWAYEGERKVLATHQSPPLSEIASMLMKRSQNNYAETMVHTIGWAETGRGTFSAGREAMREWLESEAGIDPETLQISDGSGLSRYNLVSPNQLVKILRAMWRSDLKDVWVETMPVAGVDGTLRNRMKDTPAEGNARAKTGTVSNVRGLSGYVWTSDGEPVVFSFLVNSHLTTSKATEEVTDGVLALIAGYSDEMESK